MTKVIELARRAFRDEPQLTGVGLIGLLLGAICFGAIAVHGVMVEPEGNLYKAGTFDAAVGLFLLTLVLILPCSGMSERGRRWFRNSLTGLTLFGYGVETVQVFRGLDPRFSRVASPPDQILGGLFFLSAVAIMVCFLALTVRFFFRSTAGEDGELVLAIRYGATTSMLGFAVGIGMSALGGPGFGGGGNLLPLHAAGFHGLQAVPLVAVLSGWAGAPRSSTRTRVHMAGLLWLGLCLAIAFQSFGGRSVLEPSPASALGLAALAAWGVVMLRTVFAYRARSAATV